MTEHTPGPWSWRDDINSGEWNLSPGVLITPDTDGTPGGDKIDQANARLIAAAPELLEALEAIKDKMHAAPVSCHPDDMDAQLDFQQHIADVCRAAIAKATGEK